jgi:hypothetical protein
MNQTETLPRVAGVAEWQTRRTQNRESSTSFLFRSSGFAAIHDSTMSAAFGTIGQNR